MLDKGREWIREIRFQMIKKACNLDYGDISQV